MRASVLAHDPAVRDAVVGVLFARLSTHHKMFHRPSPLENGKVMPWSATFRRDIAAQLFPRLATRTYLAVDALRPPSPLLDQQDIEFIMDRWERAAPDESVCWQSAIGWIVDWQDTDASSAVLRIAAQHGPGLEASLVSWQQSVLSRFESDEQVRAGATAAAAEVQG